ncbi:MAG: zinc-ribbon domain-containing protein [Candidatus Thorarchaeota archaeon]
MTFQVTDHSGGGSSDSAGYCHNCGKGYPAGARFCGGCGQPIT